MIIHSKYCTEESITPLSWRYVRMTQSRARGGKEKLNDQTKNIPFLFLQISCVAPREFFFQMKNGANLTFLHVSLYIDVG